MKPEQWARVLDSVVGRGVSLPNELYYGLSLSDPALGATEPPKAEGYRRFRVSASEPHLETRVKDWAVASNLLPGTYQAGVPMAGINGDMLLPTTTVQYKSGDVGFRGNYRLRLPLRPMSKITMPIESDTSASGVFVLYSDAAFQSAVLEYFHHLQRAHLGPRGSDHYYTGEGWEWDISYGERSHQMPVHGNVMGVLLDDIGVSCIVEDGSGNTIASTEPIPYSSFGDGNLDEFYVLVKPYTPIAWLRGVKWIKHEVFEYVHPYGPATRQPAGSVQKVLQHELRFPEAHGDWGVVRYWCVWDSYEGGNLIDYGEIAPAQVIKAGDVFFLPAGTVKSQVRVADLN